jgi:antibiotic biosynthesis monooxygenase (ABM) superfamily enzyme
VEQDGPVSVVVRHRVKPGREAAFEDWQRGIIDAALKFDGHLGFHVIRPPDPKRPEYLVLFKFDSLANLEAWERSAERREWLDRVRPLLAGPPELERHTGLEVWFNPPPGRPAPPRYRMAAVTLLTLYPLILGVQAAVAPHLADWPLPLRTLVTSALLVCVMTYAAMPLTTRMFAQWLYGPADER